MNVPVPLPVDYVSPVATPAWFARAFPGGAFYGRLASIVWRASRQARRGCYGDAEWIGSSIETLRALEAAGVRIAVEGLGGFAGLDGPAVVVGNHMSTLETFVLPCLLAPHRRVTFVVKRELVEMPVFKHVMISRQPVVVGRAQAREDLKIVLEEGEARLRAGTSVIVFPQTTRAATWTPAEFNSIGVKLAKRAGVPVVPLALRTDAWGIGRWVKDVGWLRPARPVRIAFGPPLAVAGNGRDAQEALVRFISDKMAAWGVPCLARPAGSEPARDNG
jgi:1-acyl-sn-glycerol-3-phosphate acyltransferase